MLTLEVPNKVCFIVAVISDLLQICMKKSDRLREGKKLCSRKGEREQVKLT